MNRLAKLAPLTAAQETIHRFPASCAFCLLFFLSAVMLQGEDWHGPLMQFSFCGCFIFIAATLAAESRTVSRTLAYGIGAAALALAALVISGGHEQFAPVAAICGASFAAMFLAPYLRTDRTAQQFWAFGYTICLATAFAFVITAVLFMGLSAVSVALKALLQIRFFDTETLWFFCAGIIAPLIAMRMLPKDFTTEDADYSKLCRIVLVWVVLPLLGLYTGILYLYMLKIALTMALPEGGVATMVMGYGIIGTAAWLAAIPWRDTDAAPRIFTRWFFILLLPSLPLLAAGLWARITDYGITEERYLVGICLIWLTIVTAYMLRPKPQAAPQLIFASLIVLLALSSFGPWGMSAVSLKSQIARLNTLLAQHTQDDDKVNESIRSVVRYLERRDQDDVIRTAFAPYKDDTRLMRKLAPDTLAANTGVSFDTDYNDDAITPLGGADYAIPIRLYDLTEGRAKLPDSVGDACALSFTYAEEENGLITLRCGEKQDIAATYDLKPLVTALRQGKVKDNRDLLLIRAEGKAPHDLMLVIGNLSGYVAEGNIYQVNSLSGQLLWKK